MSETFLYLTTRGHKSGQPHQIEIWYVQHGGRYYLVSERREGSHWVQNLLADPGVEFSVGTREHPGSVLPATPGQAAPVDPDADLLLTAAVRAAMDAKYAWSDGLIVQLTPGD
ncbi:MAG TPA: nitroreductase/quinone reductase family protein [Aggregatilineales bacterium]|jgi:deazaflavin-dependent oxidoreductase (nitroreductase family)|nr:nitroreductase/quinone reductase family protein [Aggregatilineales bacterium]